MKHVLLLAFCVLLSARVLSAQSFTVSLTPASQSITVGETATYSVVITPLNGYDATVFLSVSTTSFKGSAVLSASTANLPYENITLQIKPSVQDTGIKTITVEAKNGAVESSASCSISTTKNEQWGKVKFLGNGMISNESRSLGINPSGEITCIIRSYFTVNEYSVFEYKNKNWVYSSVPLSSTGSNPFCAPFVYDNMGMLWCAATDEIAKFDGKFTTLYNSKITSGVGGDRFQAVSVDRNGYPVFITYYQIGSDIKVIRYNGTTWSTFNTKKTAPNILTPERRTYDFCIDKSNAVWFQSKSGLVRLQDTLQEVFSEPNMLAATIKVVCDVDGGVWCLSGASTTDNVALRYFNGTSWMEITTPTTQRLRTFMVDSNKHVWLMSNEGLHFYDGVVWTNYTSSNSILPPYFRTIPLLAQDKNKNIWMLLDSEFYVFNPNGLVNIPIAPSGVDEQPAPSDGLSLYPNPTGSTVIISGSDVLGYSIVNTMGIAVLPPQEFVSGKQEVDVSGLVAGVYFVQMRTASGMVTKPIVVVH